MYLNFLKPEPVAPGALHGLGALALEQPGRHKARRPNRAGHSLRSCENLMITQASGQVKSPRPRPPPPQFGPTGKTRPLCPPAPSHAAPVVSTWLPAMNPLLQCPPLPETSPAKAGRQEITWTHLRHVWSLFRMIHFSPAVFHIFPTKITFSSDPPLFPISVIAALTKNKKPNLS